MTLPLAQATDRSASDESPCSNDGRSPQPHFTFCFYAKSAFECNNNSEMAHEKRHPHTVHIIYSNICVLSRSVGTADSPTIYTYGQPTAKHTKQKKIYMLFKLFLNAKTTNAQAAKQQSSKTANQMKIK